MGGIALTLGKKVCIWHKRLEPPALNLRARLYVDDNMKTAGAKDRIHTKEAAILVTVTPRKKTGTENAET